MAQVIQSGSSVRVVVDPPTDIPGNAATATKLATPRAINGVPFDGSGDITVTAAGSVSWGAVTDKPSTLAGYGITDAQSATGAVAWIRITGTPTTRAGYGITDAQPLDAGLTSIANLSTLGLYYLSANDVWSPVTIGANLTFSGGILASTGGGGGSDASTLGGNGPAYYTNSSNQSSGTLPDARLGTNIARLSGTNTWTNPQAFSGAVTINGDLTVNGTTTTIDATQLNVADPIISVARNNDGSVPYGGIRMVRGGAGNAAYFLFDESTDTFVAQLAADDAQTSAAQVPMRAASFVSTVATGAAPFTVASSTVVANLNASLLGGNTVSFFQNAGNLNAGTLLAARLPAFSGDFTTTAGSAVATLNTVNGNTGSFGSASVIPVITTNAKGLVTAVSTVPVNDTTKQPLTTPYLTPASTTTAAGLRVPHGAAPTTPTNGDVWTTTAGIYVRINGTTVGPLSAGGGGATLREQDYIFFNDGVGGALEQRYITLGTAQTVTLYSYDYAITYSTSATGSLGSTLNANSSVSINIPANSRLRMFSPAGAGQSGETTPMAKVKQTA